jgi:hypothetical protein
MNSLLLLFIVTVCCLSVCNSLIHHLKIHNDDRNVFKIETFGFIQGGLMELHIADLAIHRAPHSPPHFIDTPKISDDKKSANSTGSSPINPYRMGFILRKANSESDAQQDLETVVEKGQCIFDQKTDYDMVVDLSNPKSWKNSDLKHLIDDEHAIGLYSLIFARCAPTGLHYTSFKVDATFTNPGPNYLSAGDLPLPSVYLVFFLLHCVALFVWIWVRNPAHYTVFPSYLMPIFLGFTS